ncbi:MAG TPA: hypothetical protein VMV47_07155 [Bacteroidales bacterium]|nr:hypothetical protein [Bacteroidales bacterium]
MAIRDGYRQIGLTGYKGYATYFVNLLSDIKSQLFIAMKKYLFYALIILSVAACKKTKFSPEGPTDVRIRNLTTYALYDLTVDLDTVVNYGNLNPQSATDYIRFTKAYPKATISAKINKDGSLVTFSTEKFDYTYMQFMGQMKITYEIFILQPDKNVFEVEVIPDEPLVLE